MINKNYKHFCILYPGAGGGNHLVNLISTISNFEKIPNNLNTLDNNQYFSFIKSRYLFESNRAFHRKSFFKVHFATNHLARLSEDYQNVLAELNQTTHKNIIFGHWASYEVNIKTKHNLDYLNDCVWMVVTWPSKGSVPLQRIDKHNFYPQTPEKYRLPLDIVMFVNEDDYMPTTIRLADNSNAFLVEIEKVFHENGWDYLNDRLTENLGLSLPVQSKELHNIWINAIKQDIL